MTNTLIKRAEAYRSFARLFLSELDTETIVGLQKDPRFADVIASDVRDLRVEFTHLFHLNVFPYASVFLDPEALLNTETTARVEAAFAAAGFEPARDLPIGAPDHFGVELSFIAYLLETRQDDAAIRFLETELWSWVIVFLHAVQRNAREKFYRGLGLTTRRWLLEDLEASSSVGNMPSGAKGSSFVLPVMPEDDLDSVVSFLISPAQSGIFLSKQDLSSLGHRLELPMGFGDRGWVLKSLFRSAGEFGKIAELLNALKMEAHEWVERYASDSRDYPAASNLLCPWHERAGATCARLHQMERATEMLKSPLQV